MSINTMILEENLIDAILMHDKERINALLSNNTLDINYVSPNLFKLNEENKIKHTCLTAAVLTGQTEIVLKLCERKAKVNWPNTFHLGDRIQDTYLPSQIAVMKDRVDILKILIEFELDIHFANESLETLLHCAAKHESMKAAEFLIRNKADVNALNKSNQSPLDIAIEQGFITMYKLLTTSGATKILTERYNPKTEYVNEKDYKNAVLLLLQGTTSHIQQMFCEDRYSGEFYRAHSFFTTAIMKGHWQIAKLLYEKKAKHTVVLVKDIYENPNLFLKKICGRNVSPCPESIWWYALNNLESPKVRKTLHWLASVPEFRYQMNYTCTMNNHDEQTPLMSCISMHRNSRIRLLINQGALIDVQNSRGEDALLHAYKNLYSQHGRESIILLLDLGASQKQLVHFITSVIGAHRKEFYQKYATISSILTPLILKFLACTIEKEYYRVTEDYLRTKEPELLSRLIAKCAKHTATLLINEKQNSALLKEILLKMIEERKEQVKDAVLLEQALTKEMNDCIDILEQSLLNRLTTILINPPGHLLQPYFNYQLNQYKELERVAKANVITHDEYNELLPISKLDTDNTASYAKLATLANLDIKNVESYAELIRLAGLNTEREENWPIQSNIAVAKQQIAKIKEKIEAARRKVTAKQRNEQAKYTLENENPINYIKPLSINLGSKAMAISQMYRCLDPFVDIPDFILLGKMKLTPFELSLDFSQNNKTKKEQSDVEGTQENIKLVMTELYIKRSEFANKIMAKYWKALLPKQFAFGNNSASNDIGPNIKAQDKVKIRFEIANIPKNPINPIPLKNSDNDSDTELGKSLVRVIKLLESEQNNGAEIQRNLDQITSQISPDILFDLGRLLHNNIQFGRAAQRIEYKK